MARNITNHMLRKQLHLVQQESQIIRGISTSTTNNTVNTAQDKHGVDLVQKKVTQVQGDTLIAEDGSKAHLLSPIPGMAWVCLGVANNNGLTILEKPFQAYFLTDGVDTVCLGVTGLTDEFELSFKAGDNEVRVNKEFVSIKTKHLIKNGVEQK